LSAARQRGWVLEPDAKQIMREAGLLVPEGRYATTLEEAVRFAGQIG
jgi:acyl-CoA synthetase (NDP forming)